MIKNAIPRYNEAQDVNDMRQYCTDRTIVKCAMT